jgi:hypothetical protein
MPVVPGGMQHREDNDCIFPHDEKDAIRKTPRQNSANIRLFSKLPMEEWIRHHQQRGRPNFSNEFQAQPGPCSSFQIAASAMSAAASGRTISRRLIA